MSDRNFSHKSARPSGRFGRLAFYGSSRSVVEAAFGIRGLLLAGLLGPQAFGVWALFRLVLGYGAIVGLGLLRGMELEVAKAQADERRVERLAWGRTAMGFTLAIFGLGAVALVAGSPLVGEPWARGLLWAIAAGLLLERLYGYILNYMRAAGSLRRFAALELAQAAAQLGFTLALGYFYGVEGAFVGFMLANLLALALARREAPLRPAFDVARLCVMLGVGVPLGINLLLTTLIATVDRLVVGATLGLEALGQYAFAVAVASLGLSAALVVRTVVFTDMYGRLADEDVTTVNRAHLDETVRPFALLLAAVIGVAALVLEPGITGLAPQYAAAAPAAALFLFIGTVQGVANLAILGVVAAGRQTRLAMFTALAVLLNGALAFVALRSGLGLTGLAAAALLGRLAYAAGVLALVGGASGAAPARVAVSTLWPIAWCASVATGVQAYLVPSLDPWSIAGAVAVYAVGVTPVLVVLGRMLWRRVPESRAPRRPQPTAGRRNSRGGATPAVAGAVTTSSNTVRK